MGMVLLSTPRQEGKREPASIAAQLGRLTSPSLFCFLLLSRLLFSTADHSMRFPPLADEHKPDANTFQAFKSLDARVYMGVRDLLTQTAEEMEAAAAAADSGMNMDVDGEEHPSTRKAKEIMEDAMSNAGIVSALSQALCREFSNQSYSALNRATLTDPLRDT